MYHRDKLICVSSVICSTTPSPFSKSGATTFWFCRLRKNGVLLDIDLSSVAQHAVLPSQPRGSQCFYNGLMRCTRLCDNSLRNSSSVPARWCAWPMPPSPSGLGIFFLTHQRSVTHVMYTHLDCAKSHGHSKCTGSTLSWDH